MSVRRAIAALLALVVAGLCFAAWRVLERRSDPLRASALEPEPEPEPESVSPKLGTSAPPVLAPTAEEPAGPGSEPEPPLGLGAVDLEEVRAALPDNLYWQTSAPTTDPALLEEREREKAVRNELYGKILSGTGTDTEILDYYDQRMRASTDAVQFADYLLEHYGSDLTDQDQTLLHVARRLHLARLEEIPRRLQEARERRAAQDEARRQWLEEEAEFRSDSESPR